MWLSKRTNAKSGEPSLIFLSYAYPLRPINNEAGQKKETKKQGHGVILYKTENMDSGRVSIVPCVVWTHIDTVAAVHSSHSRRYNFAFENKTHRDTIGDDDLSFQTTFRLNHSDLSLTFHA
jgi:hypothetical protein